MLNSTVAISDDAFGPFVEPLSHEQFDFTLLFEQSIFSIGPSALLLLVAPWRFLHLSKARRVVKSSPLAAIKLVSFAILSVFQCVNLTLWTTTTAVLRTRASTAAATLSLAAALVLTTLSYIEHVRSVKPSAIINVYLLFTLPLDFVQVRSLWLRHGDVTMASCYTTASGLKIGLLVVEAIEKGRILLPSYKSGAPEATSGIYSRSVFWWLNPLFLTGHRSVLSNDTLLDIDDALATDKVYERFQKIWQKRPSVQGRYSLVKALTLTILVQLVTTVIPRIVVVFFRFMQPLMIRKVSAWVSRDITDFTTNEGWGLTGAFGLVYLGLAVTSAIYYHQVYRSITMIRGALVASIYLKTLALPTSAFEESAAVTLMSTDVQKICDALAQMHEVWASVMEITIATWLLSQQISYALLGPIVVTILSIVGTSAVSNRMGFAMGSWMSAVQSRVDVTSKILESMKEVKMLGITPAISHMIRTLRINEIKKSLTSRRLLAAVITLGNASSALGPAMAFVIYIKAAQGEETFDVPRAFTALSLIWLLSGPVATLIFSFPPLLEAFACVQRIQRYLVADEKPETRHLDSDGDPPRSERVRMFQEDMELQTLEPKSSGGPSERAAVRFYQVSLAWQQSAPAVIKDVSMEVQRQSVVFLVGPVGSGKSTLLRGILGELSPMHGAVHLSTRRTAFVDQNPWIQNDTIRNNIVGPAAYDDQWYQTVTHACALDDDVAALPRRDLTSAGSAGCGLSGGQKLRVALARAIYAHPSLLLLDDCFSGIDSKAEDAIFTRLFGRHGLLRRLGVTVILSTHAAHRLSYSDRVLALSANGVVADDGPFETLIARRGYVASLVVRHRMEGNEETYSDNTATPVEGKLGSPDELRNDDDLPSPRIIGDPQVYKHYFGAAGWPQSGLFFVFIFVFAFSTRFSDFWVVLWTDAVNKHGNSVNDAYLGAFVAFGVITLVAVFGVALQVFNYMVPASARTLHERLLNTVFDAPLYFFTSTHTGQTLNRFSQDLSLVDSEMPMSLIQVTGPLCLALIQIVFISISAAYFATMLPVVIGVLYLLQNYYLRTSKQIRILDIEAKAPLFSHFLESMQGLVTIRAFGWSNEFAKRQAALLDRSQKPFYLFFCIRRWLALVLDLIVAVLSVVFMVMIVKLRDKVDPGFVALALLNIMSLNNNLTAIIQMWTSLENSMGAIARLREFDRNTPSEAMSSTSETVLQSWPASGTIEFANFCAAYSPDSAEVLQKIDLQIRHGERVGICGATGSGKSSLIASLFRMLSPTDGSILIDGADIATLPVQTVRERLIAIPQAAFLLNNSSIRDNIDPMSHATDAAIEDALIRVGLWDTLLASHPSANHSLDLDTPINLATTLSQGQAQLFCLARALLYPSSSIVVMDEVSASVDVQTEERMQRVVKEKFAGRTVLVVAHRLTTIRDFDRVVVMDRGRIVEVGEPGALLEGREGDGWFKRLWEA